VVQCAAVPAMRLLRRRNLLTQHGLAAKSGVSQGTIARIESGKRTELRVGTMKAIADALGVQPAEVTEFRPSLGLPPTE
jgi:transcriptional regulator with XRE-family HTH domain